MADLAQHLGFFLSVIPHEIVNWSIAGRTMTGFRNITFHVSEDRFNSLMITFLIVGDEVFPVPLLFIGNDFRKLINFKFLIFRRMGIIESPLLERNVSADKVN